MTKRKDIDSDLDKAGKVLQHEMQVRQDLIRGLQSEIAGLSAGYQKLYELQGDLIKQRNRRAAAEKLKREAARVRAEQTST